MIYLDNAATSWPKAPGVAEAMAECLRDFGANPGRSGHAMARRAEECVMDCREALAKLFRVSNPTRIAFMPNATAALNAAIKGIVRPGGHVVTTAVEHNAVMRPLRGLECAGATITRADVFSDGAVSIETLLKAVRPSTQLVVISHASNVTGALHPVRALAERLRGSGIPLLVDAAQTAGSCPVYPELWGIDLFAFPGHKGLLGPQGTGGLYVREGLQLATLIEGGTGSDSTSAEQPDYFPDRLEAGTLNLPGIAGLGAAVRYVLERGVEEIARDETALVEQLFDGLVAIPGVTRYGPPQGAPRSNSVTMNLAGWDSETFADRLDRQHDIAIRAGLHCAPGAHAVLGTLQTGAARFSVGPFNTPDQISATLEAIKQVAQRSGALR